MENKATPTPGPWFYEVVGLGGRWDNPVEVCEITNGHTLIAEYVRLRDAPLIAAAHSLREVAQMVLDTARDTTPRELVEAARAALARATGSDK